MSSVLNTNMASLVAQKNLSRSQDMLATSIERLSSGLRINRAKDDAAGLAISEKLLSQIRSSDMAIRNAGDAISMVQTAEGALGEVSTMLQRMRELSTQGNNGSLTSEQRGFIASEVRALRDEINKVSERLNFNGRVLLNGSLQQDATTKSMSATSSFALNNNIGTGATVAVTGISASTAAVDGTYTFGKILGQSVGASVTSGSFDSTPATAVTGASIAGAASGAYEIEWDAGTSTLNLLRGGNQVDSVAIGSMTFGGSGTQVIDFSNANVSFNVTRVTDATAATVGENLDGLAFSVGNTVSLGAVNGTYDIDPNPPTEITGVDVSQMADGVYSFAYDDTTNVLSLVEDTAGTVYEVNLQELVGGANGSELTLTMAGLSFTIEVAEGATADTIGTNLANTTGVKPGPSFEIVAGDFETVAGDTLTGIYDSEVTAPTVVTSASVGAMTAGSYELAYDAGTQLLSLTDGTNTLESVWLGATGLDFTTDTNITFGQYGLSFTVAGDPEADADTVGGNLAGGNGAGPMAFDVAVGLSAGSINGTRNAPPPSNVTAVDVETAQAGDYTFAYNTSDNTLTLLRNGTSTGSSVDLDGLTLTGTGTVDLAFEDAGISLTLSQANGATADSVGGNLALMSFSVATSQEQKITLTRAGGPTQVIDMSDLAADDANTINFNLLGVSLNVTGESNADILNALDGQTITVSSVTTATVPGTTARVSVVPTLVTGETQDNGTVITAYSAASARDGVYSLAYDTDSNVLTMTRTVNGEATSQMLDLDSVITNPAGTNTINFSALGVNFTVAGTSIDNIGADLASYTITKSSVVANGEASFQVGASNSDTIDLSGLFVDIGIESSGAFSGLNTAIGNLSAGTPTVFGALSDSVDAAIGQISVYRSDFGAMQNRLDYNISNLRTQSENITASRSRIIDTDYAAETAQLTKTQIMQQAATAMLAQANQLPNVILSLLR